MPFFGTDHLDLIGTGFAELARSFDEHAGWPGDVQKLETWKCEYGDAQG